MFVNLRDVRRNSDNALSHARHMTPTAAASVGARRRRPSPPTDGSRGRAVSKNFGRCAPAGCSATSGRSPETPGSLPSTPGPEGERQWSAASATLRSAPRPHRLRRASTFGHGTLRKKEFPPKKNLAAQRDRSNSMALLAVLGYVAATGGECRLQCRVRTAVCAPRHCGARRRGLRRRRLA